MPLKVVNHTFYFCPSSLVLGVHYHNVINQLRTTCRVLNMHGFIHSLQPPFYRPMMLYEVRELVNCGTRTPYGCVKGKYNPFSFVVECVFEFSGNLYNDPSAGLGAPVNLELKPRIVYLQVVSWRQSHFLEITSLLVEWERVCLHTSAFQRMVLQTICIRMI